MGRKGKESSEEERNLIIRLHNQCKSLNEISQQIGRPRSTVQSIINRFCVTKSVKNKPRSGRPEILSKQDKHYILREIKKNPKISAPKLSADLQQRGSTVSASTVRNICRKEGYHGRVPRKKFWVGKANRKKRLLFAQAHRDKGNDFWNKVIFSDESKFNIFGSDGRQMVWRQKNCELQPKNLVPTVKHGGGSVLVWGCMSSFGVGKLHIIRGKMDQYMYIDILKQNLHASALKMGLGNDFIFQQDNDPKHTAHNTKLWLLYNTPKQLHTPPQSPDVNPIEHLWSILESKIRTRSISNKNDIEKALQEEWNNIPPSVTAKLVDSMPRRLDAVIKVKGNPTKY